MKKNSLFQFHDDFISSETVNSNTQMMLLFNVEHSTVFSPFHSLTTPCFSRNQVVFMFLDDKKIAIFINIILILGKSFIHKSVLLI